MLGSWWRRMRGRTGAPAARRHPEPQLPSDSLFDDLRHEAAAQCQAAASVYPSTPAPLSRTLEKTVAATEKREKAARR